MFYMLLVDMMVLVIWIVLNGKNQKENIYWFLFFFLFRFDPQTNQWNNEIAPTSSCRASVGVAVAVLDGYLYAIGESDGQCPLSTGKEKYFYSVNIILLV